MIEREKYETVINNVYKNLESSIPKINEMYPNYDFNDILDEDDNSEEVLNNAVENLV